MFENVMPEVVSGSIDCEENYNKKLQIYLKDILKKLNRYSGHGETFKYIEDFCLHPSIVSELVRRGFPVLAPRYDNWDMYMIFIDEDELDKYLQWWNHQSILSKFLQSGSSPKRYNIHRNR